MPNRIDQTFHRLRENGHKGFIAYITAGDPSFARTVEVALALEKCGVDILELGVPFSDPLADGIVNQMAAQRALEAGATTGGVLEAVRQIRKSSQIPIVLFTYLNPVYAHGYRSFLLEAEKAGVDGILILDLPPDEALLNEELENTSSILSVRLVAPTTPPERISQIVSRAEGFIYYVSREGVTGAQTGLATGIEAQVAELKSRTELPVALGFGISTPEQASAAARFGDAVVVGSAIVKQIATTGDDDSLADCVADFTRPLVEAVKSISE